MADNVSGLLLDAAYLMGVGMLVVFLFLSGLIGATNFIAWIVSKYPDSNEALVPKAPLHANNGLSKGVIAAITAAIHQHRNK